MFIPFIVVEWSKTVKRVNVEEFDESGCGPRLGATFNAVTPSALDFI